jgi:pimeloyl-ACP methyl ester carboxylesterase
MQRQEIDVLGVKTSFYQLGLEGNRPLLLVHGMTSSGDSYREIMHGLAPDFYMFAPDLPGFGYSNRTQLFTFEHLSSWLAAFCDQVGLQGFGLIGHSFGGALAARFTAAFAERVTRLLLAAPPIYNNQSYPTFLRRLGLHLGLFDLGAALSKTWPIVNQRVRAPFYAPELISEEIFERRTNDYRRARATGAALKALAFSDLESCLEQIEVPVCLVWGENDDTVPPEDADRVAAQLENATTAMIPACGHVTVQEQPEHFLEIASRFFLEGE